MKTYESLTNKDFLKQIKGGHVGVIPTDTIYGLVALAADQKAVGRLYRLKKRDESKPLIVLIPEIHSLKDFGVTLTPEQKAFLSRVWPGEVSVILKTKKKDYLTLSGDSLAFRLPKDHKKLRRLLQTVGPLVAPSANPEGLEPARNLNEAEQYFGEKVDFYVDGGELTSIASTLVDYSGIEPVILRQGATEVQ